MNYARKKTAMGQLLSFATNANERRLTSKVHFLHHKFSRRKKNIKATKKSSWKNIHVQRKSKNINCPTIATTEIIPIVLHTLRGMINYDFTGILLVFLRYV